MRIEVEVTRVPGLPSPDGAHALAWSCILDEVFADAFMHGITDLEMVLPCEALRDAAEIRADLTSGGRTPGGTAAALLTGAHEAPPPVSRVYVLSFGVVAPRGLRRLRPPVPVGGVPEQTLSVLSWQARGLGIPIRLSGLLKQPNLSDRFMYVMRRRFVAPGHVPAYYHLTTWTMP